MSIIKQRVNECFESFEKGELKPLEFFSSLIGIASYLPWEWQRAIANEYIIRKLEELIKKKKIIL